MTIYLLDPDSPICVTGHHGLVGSAIVRALEKAGYSNLVLASRAEVDLRRQSEVETWLGDTKPKAIYVVAGTVGGVAANSSRPAEFLYDNMMIHANVIHAAHRLATPRLLYLGSSCIYPRLAQQPITEDQLLKSELEPTNEAYAVAKIAGVKMCQYYRRQYGDSFISAMPTNLYGPGDNFDPESSHVIPALMRKFEEARLAGAATVEIWGSGTPSREFLHVDDLADACLHLMSSYDQAGPVNVGTGIDITIRDLAYELRDIIYPGVEIVFDLTRPDGTPRKLLDVSKLHATGWRHSIELSKGLRQTYAWFRTNTAGSRGYQPA